MWPVNIAKPLLSKFVLPEEEPAKTTLRTPLPASRKRKEPDSIVFQTPRRSQQIRSIVDAIGVADPTQRLLFRKIGSHLDHQNVRLAAAEAKIRNLEHQVDRNKKKKKQKVTENPNSRFIRIEDVINTRARMEQQLQPEKASRSLDSIEFKDLCHEWQL